ncbi:MAG TPA: AI-2E family transporter [Flavobacteriaceae bacterium]|nr:AI-2E family transporter [Flavobacteriaceae bacterium]MCB9212972.1 AI-2E family transporter [Alteromonas sp.]HPF11356.1 AI-2E family transporter [Flavobacteriaceae bacterium]HQU20519.1 AI-2E family transporter [Flavobacteriaceae bacterium]HQU65848.1 AI-2E family transporter [Flavobacteriaceae bacterium]
MKTIPQHIIRQIFILLLIIIMGGLIFRELLPYFSGVLGAITLYVLLRGWMVKLVRKGWNVNLASTVLCLLSFVGILLPISGVILLLGNKIGHAVNNSERVIHALKDQLELWQSRLGFDLASKIDVGAISSWLSKNLQSVAGGTFEVFIAIGLMYFILFYLLTNRSLIKNSIGDYVPVNKKNLKVIGEEIKAMVRSNALGIPLVAIAQGIVALIGFLIFGVEDPFFWFVIVTIGSMIPFVGTLIGIVPVFILEISSGNSFTAWAILIYGLVVVGSTDNIIRLYVLKRLDNVHPLITLIGVIVGVPLFGFIGLIFGPLLISLFLVLLTIYRKEYPEEEKA